MHEEKEAHTKERKSRSWEWKAGWRRRVKLGVVKKKPYDMHACRTLLFNFFFLLGRHPRGRNVMRGGGRAVSQEWAMQLGQVRQVQGCGTVKGRGHRSSVEVS